MRALLYAALAVLVLSAAGRLAGGAPAGLRVQYRKVSSAPAPSPDLQSLCPARTLPDGRVCIPVPAFPTDLAALDSERSAHRERNGQWRNYDQIPRRPDRPTEYERYALPLQVASREQIVSGYDLDLPDALQRRGDELSAVGHGGVDIVEQRGAEVRLIALERQQADAVVLYVGPLFGNTVVTHHILREGGEQRDYLMLFGHLERPAPGLHVGQALPAGSLVGLVGDSGSAGIVHLHLEIRRVRTGVSPTALGSGEYVHNARTVACDPRNVLLLRP
ncbi:MAG: M23 family metallopeptidase [Polyangiaceae bacterium]|nr:M23 family metallopeptidase [Polyangiaceae bacterium]